MNEKYKEYSIKVILTIPAICFGILSVFVLLIQWIIKIPPFSIIFKPVVTLWNPPKEIPRNISQQNVIPSEQEMHDFH